MSTDPTPPASGVTVFGQTLRPLTVGDILLQAVLVALACAPLAWLVPSVMKPSAVASCFVMLCILRAGLDTRRRGGWALLFALALVCNLGFAALLAAWVPPA